MQQLGPPTFEVDGVTVLADHADRGQWWYLPTQVALGRRPDGTGDFSMIKYKPAAVAAGARGGGFLSFRSVLVLPEATRNRILGRIAALVPGGEVRLAPVPIENGTVRCLALNLEGGGGAVATPPPPGAFNAVTKILGATRPSLVGDESAAFSLVLDQEGATIVQRAFEQGATPIGVIYELDYSALTPDLHVEITADLDRVYTHFSAAIEAQIYWVRAGIDAGFEKLVQDGAITIKVIDFSGAEDRSEKEKWALDFFKNDLLAKWFEPSLDLGQLKGPAQPEGLDAVLERLKKLAPGGGAGTQPTGGGTGVQPTGGGTAGQPTGGGTTGQPTGGGTATGGPATSAPLPPATLTLTATTPAPLPPGFGLSMTPAAAGTTETLQVQGPAGAVVTVDGSPRMLDATGRLTLDVAAGTTHPVTVDWPASPPVDETFSLLFTFDQPHEQGFSATPNNPVFGSYLRNAPAPPDPAFSQSTAPGRVAPPSGAAALQEWLDRLATPKNVTITAHASFEGDSTPAKTTLNQRLSERRLAIARGIVANRAVITSALAQGFSRAQAAGRLGAAS
ncbi:MAG: hypothetical protein ACRDTC_18815, partial [Pseudonocardiaceae bacterium]